MKGGAINTKKITLIASQSSQEALLFDTIKAHYSYVVLKSGLLRDCEMRILFKYIYTEFNYSPFSLCIMHLLMKKSKHDMHKIHSTVFKLCNFICGTEKHPLGQNAEFVGVTW